MDKLKIIALLALSICCLVACNPDCDVNMTAKYQILVPEATENLIRNPSAEVNLNDWTAQGSAIERSNDAARFGSYSLQVTTNGAIEHEGVNVRSYPNTSGQIYAGSVYVRGAGSVRVRIRDNANGDEFMTDTFQLTSKRWLRIDNLVGRTGQIVSDDLRLHVETVGIQATTFYVDAVQIEEKPYSTTYTDGDQDGGSWRGTFHDSTSYRLASDRTGGYFVNLDEGGIGVYPTGVSGVGMPPLRHNLQDRALAPGLGYQSTKVEAREIMITLFARSNRMNDIRVLHEKRQELIDIIKPDLVSPTQHFTLRYLGGAFPMDIDVLYEAGFEFEGDVRNGHYNSFMLRLLANDPFWREDDQETYNMDYVDIVSPVRSGIRLIDDEWQSWGQIPSGSIQVMEQHPNGDIYVCGLFTTIDGVAVNNVARWDGENWHALANGLDNTCQAMAISKSGLVYVGGIFTFEFGGGGIGLNRIAVYDPATNTWASLNNGLNNSVLDIVINDNGQVYVCGSFDDIQGGGGNTLNLIARWNPVTSTWHAMGAGPGFEWVGFFANAMTLSPNCRTLYVGGSFMDEFGMLQDLERIAQYDIEADTFSPMGSGANSNVLALAASETGEIYAGGDFTVIGGAAASHIAKWNGTAFTALGEGAEGNYISEIYVKGGSVYAGGRFTSAGGLDLVDSFAVWREGSWSRPPVDLPDSSLGYSTVDAVLVRGREVYLGGVFGWVAGGLTNALTAALNEIDNIGTSSGRPILEVEGPGTITWLENRTGDETVYLDYELDTGEILTIDTSTGRVTSNWKGNALSAVIPGSDFIDFMLNPGLNNVTLFIVNGDENTRATLRFIPLHWSIDGSVK